jgi:hypothetical protein
MTRPGEPAVVALLLTLAVGWAALEAVAFGPAARRMPLLVALPTLALLVVELARARGEASGSQPGARSRERVMAGWIVTLVAATLVAGVIAGPALTLGAYVRLQARERWTVALGLATAFGAIVYAVLDLVLQLPAGGVIGGWPR